MIGITARLAAIVCCSGIGVGSPQSATVEGTLRALKVPVPGAVVSLLAVRGADTSHVGAARPGGRPRMIDQVNLRFVPRVLAVRPGTAVVFRNSDPILHNVFSPEGPGAGFDLGTYPRNRRRFHTFTEIGVHVILCHVHPEMVAYVAVVPTPYHAVVDRSGRFRIPNVPPGRYTLRVWHPRAKAFESTLDVPAGGVVSLDLDLAG